jgi:hypothetical protein
MIEVRVAGETATMARVAARPDAEHAAVDGLVAGVEALGVSLTLVPRRHLRRAPVEV